MTQLEEHHETTQSDGILGCDKRAEARCRWADHYGLRQKSTIFPHLFGIYEGLVSKLCTASALIRGKRRREALQ